MVHSNFSPSYSRGLEIVNGGAEFNGKGEEGQWNPASSWFNSLL